MERLLKHKLVIGLVAVLVAASAGVAYAATQSGSTSKQTLLNDVAKRLNVTPSQLRSAIKGALLDRLQAAVKAGKLTQAQANRIKERIQRGALPIGPLGRGFGPLGGRRGFGPPGFGRPGFGPHRFGPPGLGPPGLPPGAVRPNGSLGLGPRVHQGPLAAAAKYLGVTPDQLLKDLRAGKALAQVAQAHGKSVTGLERAMTSPLKARLDRAVATGWLTKAQEQRMVTHLNAAIAGLIKARGFRPAPGPAVVPGPKAPSPLGA